ncbi:hypothetical protein PAXRUDRAFT_718393 [Paxillus rubicundulus Ve08.2h10]|uniref:Uncharacterized protein n=1 Tax=Paxillus rubicundulus Ve08.2h10 TaxID=930991 RepID=A0A0D0CI62_9AGAM|nr:hypothetical protein PAXRUDRAFT_718393 [Paxillus rubicundulus Ve08.2h10]
MTTVVFESSQSRFRINLPSISKMKIILPTRILSPSNQCLPGTFSRSPNMQCVLCLTSATIRPCPILFPCPCFTDQVQWSGGRFRCLRTGAE